MTSCLNVGFPVLQIRHMKEGQRSEEVTNAESVISLNANQSRFSQRHIINNIGIITNLIFPYLQFPSLFPQKQTYGI